MTTFTRFGFGETWAPLEAGRNDTTGRSVELRLLPASVRDDPERQARLNEVVARAGRVRSEHVAQVLGSGLAGGEPVIAFEPVLGRSVAETLRGQGPFGWPAALAPIRQVAMALGSLHDAGLLHGNLTSSNVKVPVPGFLKLTDVGLDAICAPGSRAPRPATWRLYAPPEGVADPRSDLYSLGVLALELLTGPLPQGTDPSRLWTVRARELNALPVGARNLLGWLLAEDPAGRPASAAALLAALDSVGVGRPSGEPAYAPPYQPAAVPRQQRPPRSQTPPRSDDGAAALGRIAGVIVTIIAIGVFFGGLANKPTYPTWPESTPYYVGGEPYPTDWSGYGPFDTGYVPDVLTEDAKALVAKLQDPALELDGTIQGDVWSDDGSLGTHFDGTFRVKGDDSEIAIAPGRPADGILPSVERRVAVSDTVFTRGRSETQWLQAGREPDRRDVVSAAFAAAHDMYQEPLGRIGMFVPQAYAAAFGLAGTDTPLDGEMFVQLTLAPDATLETIEMRAAYLGFDATGALMTRHVSFTITVKKLTDVSPIVKPTGEGSAPTATGRLSSALPTASTTPSGTRAPSSPLAQSPVEKQLLATIHKRDFQFEGPVQATSSGAGGTLTHEFTGTMAMSGNDDFIELSPSLMDEWMPYYSTVARVGDQAYQQVRWPRVWKQSTRTQAGADCLRRLFDSVDGFSYVGTVTVNGVAAGRYQATVPNWAGQILGLTKDEHNPTGDVRLEVWATPEGVPVGLSIETGFHLYAAWDYDFRDIRLEVTFTRVSGVRIHAPG